MTTLNLNKLEKVEKNEEEYHKAVKRYVEYGNHMFYMDVLYHSGCVYRLPFIPYAVTLSDNCYLTYNEDTREMCFYRMNEYIQPVFSMTTDGYITHIHNEEMPRVYINKVAEFVLRNLIEEEK